MPLRTVSVVQIGRESQTLLKGVHQFFLYFLKCCLIWITHGTGDVH